MKDDGVFLVNNILVSHAKAKPGPEWRTYVMSRHNKNNIYKDEIVVHVFGKHAKAEEVAAYWSRGEHWSYKLLHEEA